MSETLIKLRKPPLYDSTTLLPVPVPVPLFPPLYFPTFVSSRVLSHCSVPFPAPPSPLLRFFYAHISFLLSGVPFREHRETAEEYPVLEARTFLFRGVLGNAHPALRDHGRGLRADLHQVQEHVTLRAMRPNPCRLGCTGWSMSSFVIFSFIPLGLKSARKRKVLFCFAANFKRAA